MESPKTPRVAVACFAFVPDLSNFEEDGDERTMRTFCDLARNGEGCSRYALLMDRHGVFAIKTAWFDKCFDTVGWVTKIPA